MNKKLLILFLILVAAALAVLLGLRISRGTAETPAVTPAADPVDPAAFGQRSVVLTGVGGQGILSIATVLGEAATASGLFLKQAEVHGMSQRGGDVQSNLRISSEPIASDLIPKGGADVIISMEPMEALRYLPFLNKEGWIITSSAPFVNIPNYPDMESIEAELARVKNVIAINIEQLAKDNGVPRSANVILLGAAQKAIGIAYEKMEEAVRSIFARKGDAIVEANIKALSLGRAAQK